MPKYPLLPLPASEPGDPPDTPRGGCRIELSRKRQDQRIGPVFKRLASVLNEPRNVIWLRDDPSSIAPERALVLEVVDSTVDFQAILASMSGLEFLRDEEINFEPNDDFFELDTRKGREGRRREDRNLSVRN